VENWEEIPSKNFSDARKGIRVKIPELRSSVVFLCLFLCCKTWGQAEGLGTNLWDLLVVTQKKLMTLVFVRGRDICSVQKSKKGGL